MVAAADFGRFDYVLAMDSENLRTLRQLCSHDAGCHLGLFLDFAPHLGVRDVPDPYYGAREGFEQVLDLLEQAADGFLAHLRKEAGKRENG